MEEGVAGPEIKTIKEHQSMAKEKKHNKTTPMTAKNQNQFRQTLLCH